MEPILILKLFLTFSEEHDTLKDNLSGRGRGRGRGHGRGPRHQNIARVGQFDHNVEVGNNQDN